MITNYFSEWIGFEFGTDKIENSKIVHLRSFPIYSKN
jgi:hypothetical protein